MIQQQAELLTEIFVADGVRPEGSPLPARQIWQRDISWIKQADVVIAEVTNPSLGVGYEIAKAEEWGKPVLALFRDDGSRKLSAMIGGSPGLQLASYLKTDEARLAIDSFLKSL